MESRIYCDVCNELARQTYTVSAIGYWRGRTYFPGEKLHRCMKHARELRDDLERAELLLPFQEKT